MRRVFPVIALLALVACDQSGFGVGGRASAKDSVAALNAQLAEAKAVAAQQDSLMQGFTQTTKLLDDIDKELSTVKGLKSHLPLDVKNESGTTDPKAAYRASLLGKVQEVTKLLSESRARVQTLSKRNTALQGKIAEYEQTITTLQSMIDRQKTEIAELTGKVDSLTTANTQLAATNAAMGDTVTQLRRDANTVYYVVGTKKELMAKGIIVEEGSKFLFFGHKALVPARTLDPSAFTPMNKWSDLPITLHIPDRPFKVVSRQDPSLIEQVKTADGKPTGVLHVTKPAEFWATSKFLIIVEG
ncbi:MAG: hypothetical protein IRY91_13920 [Gemmatimonadaceae bacterium]|nr:hypothetical protein [Gemmatimonadaceae bacterium]